MLHNPCHERDCTRSKSTRQRLLKVASIRCAHECAPRRLAVALIGGHHAHQRRLLHERIEGHLEARWEEGCRNAPALWRETRSLSCAGSPRQVSRWAQQCRTEPHPCTPRKHRASCLEPLGTPRRGGRLPSTRRLAWVLVLDPEALSLAEAASPAHMHQDAEVASLHELARTCRRMVREQRPEDPDGWLTSCEGSRIGMLMTFAKGLRQDYAAVRQR